MKALQGARGATLLGLLAILFWSSSVGVTRSTAEALGAIGAPAVLFTVAALMLLPQRVPLQRVPRRYLWLGGTLFVAYQLCFVLAVGLARTRIEAIEVGIVNYLWPSLTVLCSTIADRLRPTLPMLGGLALAVAGLATAASPADGFALLQLLHHAAGNPVSYGLALAAAVLWALYSTATKHLAGGQNALWYFMVASAALCWLLRLVQPGAAPMQFSSGLALLVLSASAATALAYTFWNHGLLHGNIHVLALAANGTPLLAALFASLLLQTTLPVIFWLGTLMVVCGSALAGLGTRRRRQAGE